MSMRCPVCNGPDFYVDALSVRCDECDTIINTCASRAQSRRLSLALDDRRKQKERNRENPEDPSVFLYKKDGTVT